VLLANKNTVIYGAAGSMGGAVARAFAREGATVFLTGRTLEKQPLLQDTVLGRLPGWPK
jgi:3-oxoacyl-[acyl-carrier protein] reductase